MTNSKDNNKQPEYIEDACFAGLNEKIGLWKSLYHEWERMTQIYGDQDSNDLLRARKDIENYIKYFDKKEKGVLSSSEKTLLAYSNLVKLLETGSAVERVAFQLERTRRAQFPNLEELPRFMESLEALFNDRTRQKKRIECIRSLLKHEKKQEALEKKLYQETFKKEKAKKESFGEGPTPFELSMKKRLDDLCERIKKDEAGITEIEEDLNNRARNLLKKGDGLFSEKTKKELICFFKKFYPQVQRAVISDCKLSSEMEKALCQLKKTVESEKKRLFEEAQKLQKKQEKTSVEKIQAAFEVALQEKKNLILAGKHRSLGLIFSVIGEISKDDEYRDDIIEHIAGFLDTPWGRDYIKGGNTRWKPVQGSESLYELSIDPKSGHRQNMPRLYAKKEAFVQDGDCLVLTSAQEKKRSVWILVKKGNKRTPRKDIQIAERVHFANDGKRHEGKCTVNDLEWQKFKVSPKENGFVTTKKSEERE